jgi:hypothetical protein
MCGPQHGSTRARLYGFDFLVQIPEGDCRSAPRSLYRQVRGA